MILIIRLTSLVDGLVPYRKSLPKIGIWYVLLSNITFTSIVNFTSFVIRFLLGLTHRLIKDSPGKGRADTESSECTNTFVSIL